MCVEISVQSGVHRRRRRENFHRIICTSSKIGNRIIPFYPGKKPENQACADAEADESDRTVAVGSRGKKLCQHFSRLLLRTVTTYLGLCLNPPPPHPLPLSPSLCLCLFLCTLTLYTHMYSLALCIHAHIYSFPLSIHACTHTQPHTHNHTHTHTYTRTCRLRRRCCSRLCSAGLSSGGPHPSGEDEGGEI